MAMGIGYQEFWLLNPRTLSVVIEGYKLKRKVHDEEQWLLGGYITNAVRLAIVNAFKKKNDKDINYFEAIPQPMLATNEMSEQEKQRKRDMLMASLHIMKTNFDIKHGK